MEIQQGNYFECLVSSEIVSFIESILAGKVYVIRYLSVLKGYLCYESICVRRIYVL